MTDSKQGNYSIKSVLIIIIWISSTLNVFGQAKKPEPDQKYPADSLRQWTSGLMDEISKKHPEFYRYTDKGKFGLLIDSTQQSIQDSLTQLQYYRKLKPLFAKIGCLHTGIELPEESKTYLNSSNLIPLELFVEAKTHKVLVSKNYSDKKNIQIGGEVVSINGTPISVILNKLLAAIPSDGYNQTEKILLLNYRFPFWYQEIIDAPKVFKVVVRSENTEQTFDLNDASQDVFPPLGKLEKNYSLPLEFEVKDGIAILKIHSFADTAIKQGGQNFKKFVKDVFQTLQQQNIKDLIIDVRNNTGGTDDNAALLASFFFDKTFRYWDKIEVTEAVAKEIKGFNKMFYKKPEENKGLYLWKKSWITKEFDYYEPQEPAKMNFKGNSYLLTNGLCLSSCADFTAVMSYNKKAVVIGQETGGGYQGNTSGMLSKATIPTGLVITIPLQKYTNAVDLNKNFGRGTIPDHEIATTFENWIGNKDVEMDYAIQLINKK
ncbi:S41 family peptidase [Epilithonimonas caeni]|uniref:S41 family peptidase n=1 Tax=Epilithonimonas caeni TaxID=365343 RepID=UPI0009FEF79A|nr:S41 family peptidase [Epilithonimonas caeni]